MTGEGLEPSTKRSTCRLSIDITSLPPFYLRDEIRKPLGSLGFHCDLPDQEVVLGDDDPIPDDGDKKNRRAICRVELGKKKK